MTTRRVAAAALALVGAAATLTLTGGLYAATMVPVTDLSDTVVGQGPAAGLCDTDFKVRAGLARFVPGAGTFMVSDLTVFDVNDSCSGLTATVVGSDSTGTPVTSGNATVSGGSFELPLGQPVEPGAVKTWNLVFQSAKGDAAPALATPPSAGTEVAVSDGPVEELTPAEPEVSDSPTPLPAGEAPPADTVEATPDPDDSLTPSPKAVTEPAETELVEASALPTG